jgi:hypothetical protein
MNIILGSEPAEKLQENYTVLELESFNKDGKEITAYCIVDQVPIMELPLLEHHKKLHLEFLTEYKKGNYTFCVEAASHLRGKFNGDLDSFYDELLTRLAIN